jgi:hypothetical protein
MRSEDESANHGIQHSLRSRCEMPLGLSVVLLVLGVTAVVGVLGYLIDRGAARDDRREGR